MTLPCAPLFFSCFFIYSFWGSFAEENSEEEGRDEGAPVENIRLRPLKQMAGERWGSYNVSPRPSAETSISRDEYLSFSLPKGNSLVSLCLFSPSISPGSAANSTENSSEKNLQNTFY